VLTNRRQLNLPKPAAMMNEKNPPLHMFRGSDACARAREKTKTFSEEIEKWKRISLSTDL
jgi:hypothetical protein